MKEKYLIVVDVQNDFVDGALGSPEAQAAVPFIVKKVENFDGVVLFTRDTHSESYLSTQEGKYLPVVHCVEDTPGWELIDPLKAYAEHRGSAIYNKPTFGNTSISQDIKALYDLGNVESVEFIGLDTDICVISNALILKSAVPELPVYLDPLCCAGSTPEKHEAALAVMRSCQILVK